MDKRAADGVMVSALKKVQGIVEASPFSSEDHQKIIDIEQDAENRSLMGLGKVVNTGVREVLNCDVIYVPVLSLNTASKVATLNADSLGTITMVFGLMYGKTVIAARDSIYCCQIKPENIPLAMTKRIDDIIGQLSGMGIKMVDIFHLTDNQLFSSSSHSDSNFTIGTAGKDRSA